ncbi:intraflagellar transport protein 43 homolog [Oscarella lobularis]|uniref:intraflagellar transport protein 43 homolog n=1 Tax=Oscarella lobularis TaxID=121494 RepID=UPI00331338B8
MGDESLFSGNLSKREVKRGRRAGLATGDLLEHESSTETPPFVRKTGGWAEETKPGKKSRKNQDQLEVLTSTDTDGIDDQDDPDDDAPVIPDLDDVIEDDLTAQVAAPPNMQFNRLDTFRKLDSDLHRHAGLSNLFGGNIDLKLLTKCLHTESDVMEDDVAWEWDQLFAEASSELQQEWKKNRVTDTSNSED